MAATKNNGKVFVGDVVGYQSGRYFYGAELLKYIWVDSVAEYRWIARTGEARNGGAFKAYNDNDLILITDKAVKENYAETYVKDEISDATLKDGDVLRIKKPLPGDEQQIFIVKGTSAYDSTKKQLHRVTGGDSAYDRLSSYVARWGELQLMTDKNGNRFSA